MRELKANIETLAKEEGKTPLEIISLLQAAAAAIGDDEQLEALCELKWDYISYPERTPMIVTTSKTDGKPANGDTIKVLSIFEGDQDGWIAKVGIFEYNNGLIDLKSPVKMLVPGAVDVPTARGIFDEAKADWRLQFCQSTTGTEFAQKC